MCGWAAAAALSPIVDDLLDPFPMHARAFGVDACPRVVVWPTHRPLVHILGHGTSSRSTGALTFETILTVRMIRCCQKPHLI